jgi:hypothetical protein
MKEIREQSIFKELKVAGREVKKLKETQLI